MFVQLELKFETEGLMHFSKHRGNKTLPDDPLETARKQRDTDTDSRETEYNGKCSSRTVNCNYSNRIYFDQGLTVFMIVSLLTAMCRFYFDKGLTIVS